MGKLRHGAVQGVTSRSRDPGGSPPSLATHSGPQFPSSPPVAAAALGPDAGGAPCEEHWAGFGMGTGSVQCNHYCIWRNMEEHREWLNLGLLRANLPLLEKGFLWAQRGGAVCACVSDWPEKVAN